MRDVIKEKRSFYLLSESVARTAFGIWLSEYLAFRWLILVDGCQEEYLFRINATPFTQVKTDYPAVHMLSIVSNVYESVHLQPPV